MTSQFTPEQTKAIYNHNHDILVSASAGSGKTTVLIKRVIEMILADTSVKELLIVTFTEAAANEMKQRLISAIKDELKVNPTPELKEQLLLCEDANISTLHAFCLQVIKRFHYVIDQDRSFSLLTDDVQQQLLKEQTFDSVKNHYFKTNDTVFRQMYQNFMGDKNDDAVVSLFLSLYETVVSRPDGQAFLDELPKAYDLENSQTLAKVYAELTLQLQTIHQRLTRVLENEVSKDASLDKVEQTITQYLENSQQVLELLAQEIKDYNQIRTAFQSLTFKALRKPKELEDSQAFETIKLVVAGTKKQLKQLFERYLLLPYEEQQTLMQTSRYYVEKAVEVERRFMKTYKQLKEEQNVLDFNDLEQLTYQILTQDTELSKMARSFYQNQFKEVLIDEYQDINALQEAILAAVAKPDEGNRFMVGDIKQSIYGFRQADPSLFLNKYLTFTENPSLSNPNERIVLADNFRSNNPIIQFINSSFEKMMKQSFGGVDYDKQAHMKFGAKSYPQTVDSTPEFLFMDSETNKNSDVSEEKMVMHRIQQLFETDYQVFDAKLNQTRPITYQDIAILTPTRANNLSILQMFTEHGMPLYVNDAKNYFQTMELTVMLSYLTIIDNCHHDIELVSVLRSPLYQFDENDLAKIRIQSRDTDFYDALLTYQTSEDEILAQKVTQFLQDLHYYQDYVTQHRLSELIWEIYQRSGFLGFVSGMQNGPQRRANLQALYERAASYESAGFKNLYQFLKLMTKMKSYDKDLAQPILAEQAQDAIQLMTIHGSKGLEFPVVFVMGMGKTFSLQDLKQANVLNKDVGLGIALKGVLQNHHSQVDTLVKGLALDAEQTELLSEYLRVLYVALSRAKQKLIMTANVKKLEQKIELWDTYYDEAAQQVELTYLREGQSFMHFLGPTLSLSQKILNAPHFQSQPISSRYEAYFYQNDITDSLKTLEQEPITQSQKISSRLLEQTLDRLYSNTYPFASSVKTTAYQAVSEIKDRFSDPNLKELGATSHYQELNASNRYLQPITARPDFLTTSSYSAAQIGSATHLVMQQVDFSRIDEPDYPKNLLQELIDNDLIEKDLAKQVNLSYIESFLTTEFAHNIAHHQETLEREVSFSSLISAKTLFDDFTDRDAQILVHGTIDGYIQTSAGIILFDYKTDYINPGQKARDIAKIVSKYRGQLHLYTQAIESFAEQKVTKRLLILLSINEIVEV
ncbi:helicase-exonuclease AddAB subunit AddA [Holzapfeliella floricola]|uniref:ATP-dependent helicase/nuclease subunit A n=1 Tax=Holzapfeliella floricola DSM 23037 = JCM 16512 TaxID=1423744 RepID=A0A0R2DU87_9LACO|nr:helicase-exonuclease AddAB subunit AddA [Holzapfeliella floricola]KRN03741.1 ATP-dependent exonuclease subunit A [Holzapfeliella floricola DSM 23037 = JCM 16512]